MKKLVYSLSLAMIVMAGCNKFEEAVTENYGEGPSIAIDIQAGAQTDSAFTVILTPAQGTTYYAYIIDESDEAEELSNYTLLKGGYSGSVVLNTSKYPTDTIEITTAMPNTTYQVYAVASNDKGVAGKVAVASITTTDNRNPGPASIKRDAANKAATVTFSEALVRGEGKVTAKYYKEWDILNPVVIPENEIVVSIAKNAVTFAAPKAPNGAYVAFSWEAGAFLDLNDNPCSAFNSGLNMSTGKFTGIYLQVPTAPFAITKANLTAPKNEAIVGEWTKFEGVFTFDEPMFRDDNAAELGDITVTYENDETSTTIKLDTASWNIKNDTLLVFKLPKAPVQGDIITVQLADGIITDVLGNPNAAYESEISWLYFGYDLTKDKILGNYEIYYISYFDKKGQVAIFDSISIEAYPAAEDTVLIKGLWFDKSEIKAAIDLEFGKMYIPDEQLLGVYYDDEDSTYYALLFATADGTAEEEFTINPDGSIVAEGLWGIYGLDAQTFESAGWWDVAAASEFDPYTTGKAQARRAAVRKTSSRPAYAKNYGRVLKK